MSKCTCKCHEDNKPYSEEDNKPYSEKAAFVYSKGWRKHEQLDDTWLNDGRWYSLKHAYYCEKNGIR